MDIPYSDHEAVMATLHVQRTGQAAGVTPSTAGKEGGTPPAPPFLGNPGEQPTSFKAERKFWGCFLFPARPLSGRELAEGRRDGEKKGEKKGREGGAAPLSPPALSPQCRRWWRC